MSNTSTAPLQMSPVRSKERIHVIDILRGISILGVILMNMSGYAGYSMAFDDLTAVNRTVVIFLRFFVQAKFYTLLSFLFGWGMYIQMERAMARGKRFAPFFARRLLALLLIGLAHAILIWDGDILVTYALLGFPLLLFRKASGKTLLIAAVVCILIPVLISTPGPAAELREAHERATHGHLQAMLAGQNANVLAEGSYLEATLHRLYSLRLQYAYAMYWATHVFGMFLLGLYAGRRRIFQNIPEHLPLFRKVLWGGLAVGVVCNLVFTAVSASPSLVRSDYYDLATRGARTIGGPALCLFYVSAIVLLIQNRIGLRPLSRFASIGRMAMSNYLSQSIVCTLIFYGYGLGLYRMLGPAISLVLSLLIYRIQMGLSARWLERYRFGPAEWLWRSLTYGRLQPLAAEPQQRRAAFDEVSTQVRRVRFHVPGWLAFLSRRLLFIFAVAFAIVYFCVLGLRLGTNSTSRGQPRSAWELAEPALEETMGYFGGILRGELGYVTVGITRPRQVPLKDLLPQTLARSGSLLGVSIAIAAAAGVVAGSIAATRRQSLVSLPTLTLTVIGISIPSFFLALLLQIADIRFFQRTGMGLFPIHGLVGYRKDLMPHIIPPALVLAARPLAHITRITFISLSEILNQDFIRTARAKGLHPRVVFWEHTLRNAGVSILTAVIVSLRFALGSLPVAEIFFNWPGLGVMLLDTIRQRHVAATATLALSLGLSFLLVNLVVDLIYRFIDPRLRAENNGGAA